MSLSAEKCVKLVLFLCHVLSNVKIVSQVETYFNIVMVMPLALLAHSLPY